MRGTPPRSITPDHARPGSANYLRNSPPRPSSDPGGTDENGWTADDREAVRLARWIDSLGVSLRRADAGDGGDRPSAEAEFSRSRSRPAVELAAACSDGTLLCELVRLLERKELTGVTWQPRAGAARLHNVGKALEEFGGSRRCRRCTCGAIRTSCRGTWARYWVCYRTCTRARRTGDGGPCPREGES